MLCPLARWQLSNALDRKGEPPRLVAAHMARCARCRSHARELAALHGRLAAGATGALAPAASGSARRRGSRRLLVGGVLAVASCAAALHFLGSPLARHEVLPREASSIVSAVGEPSAPTAAELGGPAGHSLASGMRGSPRREVLDRLSVVFTAPTALRAELDALAADGRRGARAILDLGGVL